MYRLAMGTIPVSAAPFPRHFSGFGFTLVVLIHAAVLSLVMQSRSVAMPVREEVLTLNVLTPPTPVRPEPSQPKVHPSLPVIPALLQATQAEASITTVPAPQSISVPPVPTPAAALTQPRFDADYLDNPSPPYPPLSRRLGEQGRVILRVHVLPNGQADEIHIHSSSNSSRLDQSARDTVGRWRFLPARQGEETIAAWVLVPIAFNLNT